MDDDVISIHSSHEESGADEVDRRAILEPIVQRVVDALGGYEGGAYRMGDEVGGCLRDLKKLWRKDDTDDERTVARIFWETRVLPNDLVPILLATAGKGLVEDKRAIACADLMTAMTWPIDMAEELQELDEERDKGTDYTQLMLSHLNYKAALLTSGVMQALFGIVLPPISKPAKERKERDGQIVNLILHLIRNLIFIKDLPANTHLSADQAEYSSLQTRLVKALSETHTLDLLLTIAANTSNDPLFNASNTLVLEIFYLLFRGVKPHLLAIDQSKQPAQTLHRLLAAEDKKKKDLARNASSRHSRFGTTISQPDADTESPNDPASSSRPLVLHRQAAITQESGSVLDFAKRSKARKSNKIDELAREDNLSVEAKIVLQGFARESVESSFNPFLRSLLKDIKSERPKIKEKDHLRLLYVTKWFLEFFLTSRSNEKARMRQAMDEKPKMWNELQAGIECLTQLLLLIDIMSSSVISDSQLNEAAVVLQQQLIYNGEVLDISLESLRSYKEGTQSLTYLNASVHLAYALLRMLERWGKENTGAVYVRKKKPGKRKKTTGQGIADEDVVPDVENEPDGDSEEDVVHETMFTFDAFEMKFANSEITKTLLTYLSRYRDFDSPEFMKRVVNLIHRQVVKAKAEGLYFNVSTLNLFKVILDDQKSLPKDQSSKDLVKLVNFILHRFFKALEGEPFLAVEAFFPKNRGHWKLYSSWEPERKGRHERETVEDTRFPPEVQVKKGYSWSEQIGIAIAALVDDGKTELVEWVKNILVLVIRQRNKIIEETDKQPKDDDTDLDDDEQKLTPSAEAISKFTDYLVPYISDEHAEAATKNSILKLIFRLLKFTIYDDSGDELQWTVPAAILPSDLQSSFNVIDQFLQHPIDLDGKKASQLLTKKPRRRRRRRSPSNSDVELVDDDEPKRKRREKKKKEETQYKSAQFIEDSDAEYGDMEAFLEREKALRDKAVMAAAQSGKIGTMRATGTKKRRRKGKDVEARKKGKVGNPENQPAGESSADENVSDREDHIFGTTRRSRSSTPESHPVPRARPRPRPVPKRSIMSTDAVSDSDAGMDTAGVRSTGTGRLVLSEDDDL
ncbi:timeless protein-domain-containing protein [Suillus spraguei]|nr:timeless protein-domain-containing protein [Suillus spraguei]